VTWPPADAVIFGSPTRFGNIASQLKQYIDTLGGQESTILALYNTVHHFGGIVVAPGYTDPIKFADGNPYGTSHIAGHGDLPITGTTRQAAAYQGARVVKIAAALKAGLNAS
jgi:NAD(P)H dehydrogenase (quinone)